MSHDKDWDINQYREEYDSDEHWELRKCFMERWKDEYPEERLVCLARVFANIELMGCRYPLEVMKEVSRLSEDIAKTYRQSRKNKLQRTFVSASDAAEDRAKGVKRQGGVVVNETQAKKISFIKQGQQIEEPVKVPNLEQEEEEKGIKDTDASTVSEKKDIRNYASEMESLNCMDVRYFNENMFHTRYGMFVLMLRPWMPKFENILSSCQACKVVANSKFDSETSKYTFSMNGIVVAEVNGTTKAEARKVVEDTVWNTLVKESVSLFIKQQWIASGDSRITAEEVGARGGRHDVFGTPIDSAVAVKMMKLMGWAGGGLGAGAQGIEEPIKPHLQMVNRSGLGSDISDIRLLRKSAFDLMNRYKSSECLDVDLVFSCDFSKEERAAVHAAAKRTGLASTSYGKDDERFLVVKKKLDPFSLVRAVLAKGGDTAKYKVYLPASKIR